MVATPPRTHFALASAAIEAGKHVLCEKPLVTSVEDARQLYEEAERARIAHVLGQEMRWLEHHVALARALRQGLIGRPRLLTIVRMSNTFADPTSDAPAWFVAPDGFGGWINAEAPHIVDFVRTTLGEFRSVTALAGTTSDHDWQSGDTFALQSTLDNGVIGSVLHTQGAHGGPTSVQRVCGTAGALSVSATGDVLLENTEGARPVEIPPALRLGPHLAVPAGLVGASSYSSLEARAASMPPGAARLAAAFRDLIRGEDPPGFPAVPTFADGLANTIVHEAVLASAAQHRTVEL